MIRIVSLIILFLNLVSLQAATITVTNLNDTGAGSLREALTSPATLNGDIIRFNPALIAGGSDTLRMYSSVNVNKSLTIKGLYNNTDTLYVSGQDSTRLFELNPGATNNFQLDSLVFVRARGGILRSFSADTLLISNCIISHNSTIGQGGGMYVGVIGLLYIQNSIFYKNESTGQGGGIYLSGNALVEESTFYENISNGQGTAIYSSGIVTVDGSTFYNNGRSGISGPTIYNTGGLIIRRSTICYNKGGSPGHVVYNTFGMEIYYSTIAYNSGGVFCNASVADLTVSNSVIGFDTSGLSLQYNDTFNSLGYNVISPTLPNNNLFSLNNTDSMDFDEQYLQLLPLGNYGGPTLTMMPNATSYLLENGNPSINIPAQNIPIINIREIGAAEYVNVVTNDTIYECDSLLFNGTWLYDDTLVNTLFPLGSSLGIDSVHVQHIFIDSLVPADIIQLGDSLIAPNGSFTYQWLECPSLDTIPGETNQVFYPSVSGDYSVVISSNPSCVDVGGCFPCVLSNSCTNNSDSTYTYLSSCNPIDTGVVSVTNLNQAGCDSTHFVVTSLLPTSFTTENINECDSVVVLGNSYYTSSSFNDTIIGGSANGCDSVVTYNITINYSDSIFANATSCNPADTGTVIFSGLNMFGCDSVHTTMTTFLPTSFTTENITACDSVFAAGIWISNSSTFNDTIASGAINGCDSIITYNITINYSDSTFATAISCNPADTGVVSVTNSNSSACDSVHTITTTLLPTSFTTVNITACDSTFAAGSWVLTTSTFNDTILGGASNGCDSIVTYDITINSSDSTFATATSCNPADTGIVSVTNLNVNACDSVHTITTTFLPTSFTTENITACDSVFAAGTWISSSSNFNDTIASGASNGCDSIITYNVTINYSDSTFATATSCNPADTGVVSVTNANSSACDSVHTITTTLLPTSFTTENIIACDSTFAAGSWIVSTSTFNDTILGGASNGCDSIVTYDITINSSDSTFATATSCNPADTGIVSITNLNVNACDSVHTITTTLIPTSFDTLDVTACDSALVLGAWLFVSSSFEDTIVGAAVNGCDSIVTYNVTINYSDSTFEVLESCNPADTGTIIFSGLNVFGCDSAHATITTLLPTSFATENITACDSAFAAGSWIVSTSTFNDTILGGASNGCDSITTYNVTINYSDQSFAIASSCLAADTGVASVVYSNLIGCDSTHTITTTLLNPVAITNPAEDTSVCNFNGDYLIDLDSYSAVSYEWEDGSALSSLLVSTTGEYVVSFEDSIGCIQYDTINVQFYDCLSDCSLLFPTGFSPNMDGVNDEFKAIEVCEYNLTNYALSIFNRMGEKIFFSADINIAWDGKFKNKEVLIGTYTYFLEYEFESTGETLTLRGNVTLIR